MSSAVLASEHVPHTFDEVVGMPYPQPKPPSLLIGAGMSYALVPLASELAASIASRQSAIEADLGINGCTVISHASPGALYKWAGEVYDRLVVKGHDPLKAKRAIADLIGVTRDPRFAARASVPIRGSSGRHRVAARLAKEGRWRSIWSLNWDVWLESALQSVGVEPLSERPTNPLPLPPEWVRWYESWTPNSVLRAHDAQTLVVFKPHGCVGALLAGDGTFVLTEDELERELAKQPPAVVESMKECFRSNSLIAVGWSAGEAYLRQFFQQVCETRSAPTTLTIIDPNPNDAGHKALQVAYGCDAAKSVFATHPNGQFPCTDDLFLWIQTRHGLLCLQKIAAVENRKKLDEWLAAFDRPVQGAPYDLITSWFDNFLSVWSRLCFNNGSQVFIFGTPVVAEALPTHRRDEHVPWTDQQTTRLDLLAATHLLVALVAQLAQGRDWNFSQFPGALWEPTKGHLVIPVPAWGSAASKNLGALKPLVESRHWAYQGLIRKVSLLGITHHSGDPAVGEHDKKNWAYELSRLMHIREFATAENIQWLTPSTWGKST